MSTQQPGNTDRQFGDSEIAGAPFPGERLEYVARPSEGQHSDVHPRIMDHSDRFEELHKSRSPMTCVPSEVLAHIFELYVACSEESTPGGISPRGPLYLGRVCKLWRAFADSYPSLWTSIQFCFTELHPSRQDDAQKVQLTFDLYLQRSGSLPISLTYIDRRRYDSAANDVIQLVIDRLQSHAQRWKRISLELSNRYIPRVYKFTPCNLSTLEHLYINTNIEILCRFPNPPCLDLASATNLKSFAYGAPGFSGDDIRIHWENLSEVSLAYTPHKGQGNTLYHQLWHLPECKNVTTCSLGIEDSFRPILHGVEAITLPCLQTLRIRRLSQDVHAGGGIDPLVLPRLQTLDIDASVLVGGSRHWHDGNFSRLLIRSRCTLLHLSIRDVYFPTDELVRCLELSSTLTSLRFIPYPRSQDIGDLIRGLDVTHSLTDDQTLAEHRGQELVPLLREITLGTSEEGHLDTMMSMFRSRGGSFARVATLRRAKVIFFSPADGNDMEQMCGSRNRLEKVENFREELAQWVSRTSKNENDDEDGLEASVDIDSKEHIAIG